MKRTPNINLPQFEETDRYRLEDYNEAYSIIDKEISDIGTQLDSVNASLDNIAHKGFVTYEQFGAKLKGKKEDNDIVAIKECHRVANELGLKVIQNSGTAFISSGGIEVETDVDLRGMTFILDDNCRGQKIFNILQEKSGSRIIGTNVTNKTIQIPELKNDYNNFGYIDNLNEISCYRIDGEPVAEYKHEAFKIAKNGYINGNIHYTHTSNSLEVNLKEIKHLLEFRCPKIVWNLSEENTLQFIYCTRNNVTISDLALNIPNSAYENNSTGYKGTLLNFEKCCDIYLEKIKSFNITDGTNRSGYIINFNQVSNIKIDKCELYQGWGCMGANNISNLVITNSLLNRVDTHIGMGDIKISDSTFYGGWGVQLGYGYGDILLNNVTFNINDSDNKTISSVFECYGDYGLKFGGNIYANNITISDFSNASELAFLNTSFSNKGGTHSVYEDVTTPNIFVNGLTFENKTSLKKKFVVYKFSGVISAHVLVLDNNKKIVFPKFIEQKNIQILDDNTSYIFHVIDSLGNLQGKNIIKNKTYFVKLNCNKQNDSKVEIDWETY